jgi:magnesium transporter
MNRAEKYFRYIIPSAFFGTHRTKEILTVNPVNTVARKDAAEVFISVYDYNERELHEHELKSVRECYRFLNNGQITWINIDGLRQAEVEEIGKHFGIHPLIVEDILSVGQRPKMDELEDIVYCLLNMLYYDDKSQTVEQEQVSIVLGKDFVLTFQEDPHRDVFNPIRERLRRAHSKHRVRGTDYMVYSMLDLIVDNYFYVMEKLGDRIEALEEDIIRASDSRAMARINKLRKEMIVLKRNIAPVRDLMSGIIRAESDLLEESNMKYFKDVHDHIIQAYDLSENYRDMMISMQDLYINNVNLKMNEVMKVIAIVTCLLAPATVIGGIFGMNFDFIPTLHNKWGFYTAVGLMLFIPVVMLYIFRRRGWF